MTEQEQMPGAGLELTVLLKMVQDGAKAEELIKTVESVMESYRDAVFSQLLKKQNTDSLHNLNSVCVALGMIHTTLKNRITNKKVAEAEMKNREEE